MIFARDHVAHCGTPAAYSYVDAISLCGTGHVSCLYKGQTAVAAKQACIASKNIIATRTSPEIKKCSRWPSSSIAGLSSCRRCHRRFIAWPGSGNWAAKKVRHIRLQRLACANQHAAPRQAMHFAAAGQILSHK